MTGSVLKSENVKGLDCRHCGCKHFSVICRTWCRDDGEDGQSSRGRGTQRRGSARIAQVRRQTGHSG